jgi:hypothetical protein
MTLAEAWDALVDQHANGKAAPAVAPKELALRQIKLRPEVFQHRRPAKHASEAHVRELTATARVRMLEPVTVWWDGRHWTCIDGHHRIAAYRQAGVGHEVPVQVFQGTPEQASLQAARGNTRDKLQMSESEKMGAAWRIVTTSSGASKAETAEASGASERSVASMRKVRDKLRLMGHEPAEMSWEAARRMAAGEAPGDAVDWDARTEQEAQEMAGKLLKALGKRGHQRVEVLARALELYASRLPEQLGEYWSHQAVDEEDAL